MRRLAVGFLLLTACTSQRRLDTIERRLQQQAEADEDRHKQLDRIEAEISTLQLAVQTQSTANDLTAMAEKLDTLDQQLEDLAKAKPAAKRRPEPAPGDVYAVPVDGYPADGPADALVTIVRAYDYACPYCEKSRQTMTDLRAKYGKDLRVVYRQFVVHPAVATLPAEAACAAHKQGLFAQMDERLWTEAFPARQWDQAEIDTIAGEIGANLDQLHADSAGDCVGAVGADMAEMAKFGVGATPTFFINGHYMSGAQPLTAFEATIDDELKLAKSRLKKGGKKARKAYYATWILGKGKAEFHQDSP
jgi:protein-disulfide isomerase